jgi:glucosylceramidase
MKTNNDFTGLGTLKPEYYPTWASYFIKFLDEYSKNDLSFWAITTQNEPMHGIVYNQGFNCMGWTAESQRIWIKEHLGPTLASSNHSNVKIIMHDDQRWHLKNYTQTVKLK